MNSERVRLSSLFWRRNDFRNDFQGDLGDDKRKDYGVRNAFQRRRVYLHFFWCRIKVSKRLSG